MTSKSEDGDPDKLQLSDDLASADVFRRARATLRLGRHADPQALDQLLALLADPDWPVVEAALKALRRYRDPRIVLAVRAVVARNDSFRGFTRADAISTAVARALRSQGEAGFQALLTMLREFREDEIWGQAIVRQLAVLRDPRAIEPLIECFSSPVFEVANRAARLMRHFGADAIPPLIATMSITDQSVYFHVAWALRGIGAPAVPALLDALRYATDGNIRSGAAEVLDMADSKEVREALRAALEDPYPDVRRMAMWSLGDLGDPRVLDQLLVEQPSERPGSLQPASTIAHIGSVGVPQLIAALEDRARPAYQRVNAARALGLIEDERTVEALVAALQDDDDEDVRVAAIFALGDLKYAGAVKPLLAALAVEPLLVALQDPSSSVRERAVYELAAIDDDRALDAVMRFIRNDEEDDQSAYGVLQTLALLNGKRALPLLREVALNNNPHPYRWLAAISALIWLGAPGVAVLLEVGHDPRPERRHTVIEQLMNAYRRSPDPRIVDFLVDVIQEDYSSSRIAEQMHYHATLALAECGDPRSVGPLLEYLQNPAIHRELKYSTIWPLGELGDERVLEALTAAYEESMAEKEDMEGTDDAQQLERRYAFQDALLRAIEKIRARLGTTKASKDSSEARLSHNANKSLGKEYDT